MRTKVEVTFGDDGEGRRALDESRASSRAAASTMKLQDLVDQAQALPPIRIAVVDAAQGVVIETLHKGDDLGIVGPRLIGDAASIAALCKARGWKVKADWIIPAATDSAAAVQAVEFARTGQVDAVMKGAVHTDLLMHALLEEERGLRVPGRRVSHVFVVEVSTYPKLLGITDAAINIAPDLNAKAQIVQNTVDLFRLSASRNSQSGDRFDPIALRVTATAVPFSSSCIPESGAATASAMW